jgi:energy-coupling factor transporter ATP-binding protein EcfA2
MSTAANPDLIVVAPNARCPQFEHSLGRINVLLGTNGTGKSTLIEAMRGPLGRWVQTKRVSKISVVHGNRVLLASSRSTRPRNEATQHREFVRNMFDAEDYNQNNLQRSAESLLESLCQDELRCAQDHSQACTAWQSGGMNGLMPERQESQLTRFKRLFTHVFPDITLEFNVHDVSVQCVQRGTRYEPNGLSTGEKQVFLLLGRFIRNDEPECFLIDEPDRNLNPKLAERFWATIEDWHHPESVFVYATHLPSFAIRPNVDRVFLLDGEEARQIDGSDGFLRLPSDQRAEFLGTIPSIVIRDRVLVVEGEDGGIDELFYRYLLGDEGIEIVPVRDCHRVRGAVLGVEPWHRITTGVTIAGVIDRDFRSDAQLSSLASGKIISLPVHEIESLLCLPECVEAVLQKKYSEATRPDVKEVVAMMRAIADERAVRVAVRRTLEVLSSGLSVSTPTGEEIEQLRTDAAARDKLIEKQGHLQQYVGNLQPASIFDVELARVRKAVNESSWNDILALCEGKQLVRPVCGKIGVKDPAHLLKELMHHCPHAGAFPALKLLRERIQSLFC